MRFTREQQIEIAKCFFELGSKATAAKYGISQRYTYVLAERYKDGRAYYKGVRRKYSEETKRKAVMAYATGKYSLATVAHMFGIFNFSVIKSWHDACQPQGLPEQQEIKAMRKKSRKPAARKGSREIVDELLGSGKGASEATPEEVKALIEEIRSYRCKEDLSKKLKALAQDCQESKHAK
ncbi:MAG: transposase [Treponema sp.]|nr:transposase [Treponema sp.]